MKIRHVVSNIDLNVKEKDISPSDLYYEMSYTVTCSTFANLSCEDDRIAHRSLSIISLDLETSSSKRM